MRLSYIEITVTVLMSILLSISRSTFASIDTPTVSNEKSNESRAAQITDSTLMVNAERLELVYYRAALMALIKGKAKRLLADLPSTEASVFAQCEHDADTPAKLAKCTAALLTERDRTRAVAQSAADRFVGGGSGDWFGWLASRVWRPDFLKKLTHELVPTYPAQLKENETKTNGLIGVNKITNVLIRTDSKDMSNPIERSVQNDSMHKTNANAKKADTSKLLKLAEALRKEFQRVNGTKTSNAILKRLSASRAADATVRRRRKRRAIGKDEESSYVKKLRELNDFYVELRNYTEFIDRMNDKNSRFLSEFDVPLGFHVARPRRSALIDAADERLRHFARRNYRILSPKLFALIPERSSRSDQDQERSTEILPTGLLSPSLLSFHDDSPLSLPSILTLATLPNREKNAWLELLIEMSGAGRVLNRLLSQLRPRMHDARAHFFPAIQRLRDLHERFERLRAGQNAEQRRDLHRFGYTIVDGVQAANLHQHDDHELSDMSVEDIEVVLEEDIRRIAAMADLPDTSNHTSTVRSKRFIPVEKFGDVRVMNPFFFKHQMHEGALLRRVILSPRAFGATMTSPDFYGVTVLSPNAFAPRILSPRALYASILSPYAFGGNLLTPQAATADILSPRALYMDILSPRFAYAAVLTPRLLLADVLSPKAAQIDILSSVALSFSVLSPSTLSTKIGSPPAYVLSILSPGVMNANIQSKGFMNIQVLSPAILTYDS